MRTAEDLTYEIERVAWFSDGFKFAEARAVLGSALSEAYAAGRAEAESELEKTLLALLRSEFSSLTIDFNNQSAPNYMTVAQMEKEFEERDGETEWVSDDEHEQAVKRNAKWTAQWYPDTPIGSYSLSASSLPVLLAALRAFVPRPADGKETV